MDGYMATAMMAGFIWGGLGRSALSDSGRSMRCMARAEVAAVRQGSYVTTFHAVESLNLKF